MQAEGVGVGKGVGMGVGLGGGYAAAARMTEGPGAERWVQGVGRCLERGMGEGLEGG